MRGSERPNYNYFLYELHDLGGHAGCMQGSYTTRGHCLWTGLRPGQWPHWTQIAIATAAGALCVRRVRADTTSVNT